MSRYLDVDVMNPATHPEGKDTSHLVALEMNLARERERLASATKPDEKALRAVWVEQLEKEVAAERKFLGMPEERGATMSADDLFAELSGGKR